MKISEYLRVLGNGVIQPEQVSWGLCDHLTDLFGESTCFSMFESWSEFSGDMRYPVTCPEDIHVRDPLHAARYVFMETDDLYEGEYGESRLRLALHLSEEYRKIGK